MRRRARKARAKVREASGARPVGKPRQTPRPGSAGRRRWGRSAAGHAVPAPLSQVRPLGLPPALRPGQQQAPNARVTGTPDPGRDDGAGEGRAAPGNPARAAFPPQFI